MTCNIEATVVINKNEFRLIRYEEDSYDEGEYHFVLWHMHPEREKKQGLISDKRKCMDCDVIAPEVVGGISIDTDGYVATEWDKAQWRKAEEDRLVREGWSDEKKAEELEARRIRKQTIEHMSVKEHHDWLQERKERGLENEI